MARSVRIEFEGAFYHVMARGNRRETIFFNDDDRRFFLKTVSDARERTGWRIHAWVLMNNHYHMLIETPNANLVEGMKWLQNAYTRRINVKHNLWGRVFGDRYKSVLVEGENLDYLTTLMDYIHLNPARSGAVKIGEGGLLTDYQWSSLQASYATDPAHRPEWCYAENGFAAFGLEDTLEGRKAFVDRLERRALEEAASAGLVPVSSTVDARLSHLRRGWYWGTQDFAERVLKIGESLLTSRVNAGYRTSPMNHNHDKDAAKHLVEEGLKKLGLSAEHLEQLNGSDPRKVAIAVLVNTKTSVSLSWIANALKMKSPPNVSQQMRRIAQGSGKSREAYEAAKANLSRIFD